MVGCFVPNCKTGHSNCKGGHLFCAPKEKAEEWIKILRKLRTDKIFVPSNNDHRVCSEHFESKFLISEYMHLINGEQVVLPRERWKITFDAVPTIFLNIPSSILPRPAVSRKRLERQPLKKVIKKPRQASDPSYDAYLEEGIATTTPHDSKKIFQNWWEINSKNFRWILDDHVDCICIFVLISYDEVQVPSISKSIVVSV